MDFCFIICFVRLFLFLRNDVSLVASCVRVDYTTNIPVTENLIIKSSAIVVIGAWTTRLTSDTMRELALSNFYQTSQSVCCERF